MPDELVTMQLCTTLISVPPGKAAEWEAQGWKRVKEREPFVEPPKPAPEPGCC